jgi:uncharacterized protein with PIN domain
MTDTLRLYDLLPRFICDVHLGKLARHLRLLGFDTIYGNALEDGEIISIAREDHRIVLTRDGGILGNRTVRSYRPDSMGTDLQVREVLTRFDLMRQVRPFSRCIECNGEIMPVEKDCVIHQVPVRVGSAMERFWRCSACGKVYWQGSHYEKMKKWVEKMAKSSP